MQFHRGTESLKDSRFVLVLFSAENILLAPSSSVPLEHVLGWKVGCAFFFNL